MKGYIQIYTGKGKGKTVAVIFTKGCNFRCGYCHNPFLVLPYLLNSEPDISEKEIFDYLQNPKKLA
jgi:pyruvate formate lyase activating enzyme